MTTMPSWMQAQKWALASLWENIGVHGPSSEIGSLRDPTSDGPKQSPLSSLPTRSPPFLAQTITSGAMGTILESSKDGGRVPARTPKPMPSSGTYMTSQDQQGSISTPVTCLASTTQQMLPHEEFWDPPIESFPLSPSPVLSGPSFEMHQRLQLGLGTMTFPPSGTNGVVTQVVSLLPADTVRSSVRRSLQPQPPGMTPSCIQAILAKNRCYELFLLF